MKRKLLLKKKRLKKTNWLIWPERLEKREPDFVQKNPMDLTNFWVKQRKHHLLKVNGIFFPKFLLPIVRKNCSIDGEFFSKFLRSLEHFI